MIISGWLQGKYSAYAYGSNSCDDLDRFSYLSSFLRFPPKKYHPLNETIPTSSRVAEFLLNADLLSRLRMPAISRLQKVHNLDLALGALRSSEAGLPSHITAKDICDGHREKTLELLWHCIFGFQLTDILSLESLEKEVALLQRSLDARVRLGDKEARAGQSFLFEFKRNALRQSTAPADDWSSTPRVQLLLRWAQLVCAHYGIEVENLTVSFSDGRGLCMLIHHYNPSLVEREQVEWTTTVSMQQKQDLDGSLNDSFGTFTFGKQNQFDGEVYTELLAKEKRNFKLLHDKVSGQKFLLYLLYI